MFIGQHLLCVYADKSMGMMKNQALNVIFEFSAAVFLSLLIWALGPNIDSLETCLSC